MGGIYCGRLDAVAEGAEVIGNASGVVALDLNVIFAKCSSGAAGVLKLGAKRCKIRLAGLQSPDDGHPLPFGSLLERDFGFLPTWFQPRGLRGCLRMALAF